MAPSNGSVSPPANTDDGVPGLLKTSCAVTRTRGLPTIMATATGHATEARHATATAAAGRASSRRVSPARHRSTA